MDKKYVIYFSGGSMRGVFGAGVAKAFEKNNLYPKISAVYGASAGAMTGAYFLARQTELGASIYWENLTHNFVSIKSFYIGVWQRFQNRFIRPISEKDLHDALNISYLMKIVGNDKCLDIQKIINQDIPLNVKLLNLDTRMIEYIDARRPDILDILKASVNAFPYVHELSTIDEKKYIDAAIVDIIGLDFLRKKHPNEKIIIIMSEQIDRKLRYRVKNIIEGKFMQWMFNDPELFRLYAIAENKLFRDLEIIKTNPDLILVAPNKKKDFLVKSRTTNKKSLLQMYNLGVEAGQRALQNMI